MIHNNPVMFVKNKNDWIICDEASIKLFAFIYSFFGVFYPFYKAQLYKYINNCYSAIINMYKYIFLKFVATGT